MKNYYIKQNALTLTDVYLKNILQYIEDIGESRSQKIKQAIKSKTYFTYLIKKINKLELKDKKSDYILNLLKDDLKYIKNNYSLTKK